MRPLPFVGEGRLGTSGRQRATDKGMAGAPFFLGLSRLYSVTLDTKLSIVCLWGRLLLPL